MPPRRKLTGLNKAPAKEDLSPNRAEAFLTYIRSECHLSDNTVAAYGRDSGVHFGPVDLVKFAESMGAQGLMIKDADSIEPTLRKAMAMDGPVLVGVHVDYRDNPALMAAMHEDVII